MSLPKFDVFLPDTLNEAYEILERYSAEETAVLAGGTDLLVDIRRPIIPAHLPRCSGCDPKTGAPIAQKKSVPKLLVSLARISELKGIAVTDDEISIGSLTTITELADSDIVRQHLTALAEGAENLGSPLVRNRGTFGGNICNARPAADTLIPAYALSAKLELVSGKGKRHVPIEDFVTGPGRSKIAPGEILTRIIFPKYDGKCGSSCRKLANRKALEISVVNAASFLRLDDSGQKIAEAKICMGAVGPTPILAVKAAEFLTGSEPSLENFANAGTIAAGECTPITDHRGSALYRIESVKVLVKRTLENASRQLA